MIDFLQPGRRFYSVTCGATEAVCGTVETKDRQIIWKPDMDEAQQTLISAMRATRPELLEPVRAAAIGQEVLVNEKRWSSYGSSPLAALGFPAYRFQGDRSEYRFHVRPINRWLIGTFSSLYRDLMSALSEIIGEAVSLLYDISYPGFHILHFETFGDYDPGDPHCDMPHLLVPWLEPRAIALGDNLTFVLPLVIPRAPCGLEIFHARAGEIDQERVDWETRECARIDYRVGTLYVFSGNHYHRISPTRGAPKEHRITLQGHLIRVGDRLVAYW